MAEEPFKHTYRLKKDVHAIVCAGPILHVSSPCCKFLAWGDACRAAVLGVCAAEALLLAFALKLRVAVAAHSTDATASGRGSRSKGDCTSLIPLVHTDHGGTQGFGVHLHSAFLAGFTSTFDHC